MFTYLDKEKGHRVPISVWLEKEAYYADAKLVEQTEHLAQLPFVVDRVVLTPDGHVGYGMPIGGVIATQGYVLPSAVGVDIGCGMVVQKVATKIPDLDVLKEIKEEVEAAIPVGFRRNTEPQSIPATSGMCPVVLSQIEAATHSLGTLGGGNHFIELQADSEDNLWVMLHSGSRNLGKKVCDHYTAIAKEENAKWHSSVPKEWLLAYLPLDSVYGQEYMNEMEYCLRFAHENRSIMLQRIQNILYERLTCDFYPAINIHHNYAVMEHHRGKNLLVHRKGATRARAGDYGIVPGSQGTKSYIVTGCGNPDSFESCSHGAGRAMGRKEAQRTLNIETERQRCAGVLHSLHDQDSLEEAPSAYKDIADVMAHQTDLCSIAKELSPLAVVKG